jgi:TM2 domain-containing membrane protein YozV
MKIIKNILIILAITCCGTFANAQDSTSNKDYKQFYAQPSFRGSSSPDLINYEYRSAFISDKNPGVSCLLSLLLPGLGQMYNEEVNTGFLHMGVAILSISSISAIYTENVEASDIIAGVVFIGNYLWSAIDAPITSNKINKESRKQKLRLLENGKLLNFSTNSGSNLSIEPYAANAPLGVGLTYSF